MIIVKLSGGLGNQMFQYAAAKATSILKKTILKLDVGEFSERNNHNTPRDFKLDIFPNINDDIASEFETKNLMFKSNSQFINGLYKNINKRITLKRSHVIDSGISYNKYLLNEWSDNIYMDGHWQSPRYFNSFDEIICNSFDLSYLYEKQAVAQWSKKINSKNSVSIHVRRGDYLSNKKAHQFHALCNIDYYNNAIDKLKKLDKDLHFYVFSDDLNWCRENIKLSSEEITFVSNSCDYEDLFLMTLCDFNIIANSTFSWWAAWLNRNKNKIVIAPNTWFKNEDLNNKVIKTLVPNNWHIL